MQSLMSATDTLGHQDVRGLSAIDPHRRQWISVTMCKDVGMSLKPVLVTTPHMSVRGDNTTPISNDGIAGLGPMVRSRVQVPAGADLRLTDHVQLGRPDSEEVIKQPNPHHWGPCNPELGLAK